MTNSKRKKRRSRPAKKVDSCSAGNSGSGREAQNLTIGNITEAFSTVSVEEAKSGYKEANEDCSEAASEVLSAFSDNGEVHTTCSSSSGSSILGLSSSEGYKESGSLNNGVGRRGCKGSRAKRMVATTGTVSTVLGKDYLGARSSKESIKQRGLCKEKFNVEEAEQFLCSILGDGCELGMAVVRDVLCQCGFDVEKALDVLLDLSASTSEECENGYYSVSTSSGQDTEYGVSENLADRGADSDSRSSEGEVQHDQVFDYGHRDYLGAFLASGSLNQRFSAGQRSEELELPQKVLESLFNIPEGSEREPSTMNWRNVVKKMESFAQKRVEFYPFGSAAPQRTNYEKGAEYQALRVPASQHWDLVKSYYQKAANAYTNGQREYAAYLSEQGKLSSKVAQKADERASMEIFIARNKSIENVLTIDLHGQHVKQAIRLVKLHLLFGTYVSSVQYLRIITGCGTHGAGKSKLKQAVIDLFEKEGIEWVEENRGTMLIKLDGPREFSFLDSGSESD
ncbi:hypothetical protein Ancab_011430 [Ancistrocladus abbreviatus]